MNPVIPNDIDTIANLAGIAAISGAALGVAIGVLVEGARELRAHRRLRRQLDHWLEEIAGLNTEANR